MPAIYTKAPQNVITIVEHALSQWHQELKDADVKIGVLFKFSSSEELPALKANGHPVNGIISIVSTKDRLSKGFDSEITLDGAIWATSKEEQKYALIDHLLSRIELKPVKPKKGNKATHGSDEEKEDAEELTYAVDCNQRPCLRFRSGDWNVGYGFEDVVRRHGEHSPEYINLSAAQNIVDSIIEDQ